MSESGDDRRRGERIPINDEFAPLGDKAGNTWVSDLSLGGVFVQTEELLSVGSLIDLRFTILLDDPVVIEASAKVARHSHKPRGMGVEFSAMTAEMTARIEQVLVRRQPLDSGEPLRLPEPSGRNGFIGIPSDDDDDEAEAATTTSKPVVFARPAPVQGFDLRRLDKREFEDAVTGSFPHLPPVPPFAGEPEGAPVRRPDPRRAEPRVPDPDATTGVFAPVTNAGVRFAPPPLPGAGSKPGPQPQARARATKDEDRTRVYQTIPVDEPPPNEE